MAKIYKFKPRRTGRSQKRAVDYRQRPKWQLQKRKSILSHFKSTIVLFGVAVFVFDSADNSGVEPMWTVGRTPESIDGSFGRCDDEFTQNCVIDGDTFKFEGRDVRILGIDAPETHPPRCAEEAELGAKAADRLQAILNEGPFEMVSSTRGIDIYGRDLRWLLRDGNAIVDPMIDEGLVRRYMGGYRSSWCD